MKKILNILPIVVAVIMAFLYYNEKKRGPIILTEPPKVVTKTDTVYKNRILKPLSPYRAYVKPDVITEYRVVKVKDTRELNRMKLRILEDSLHIESLERKISIHENYLKLFPENPKLVDMDIGIKSLSLSLLEIDGVTRKYDYPINLFQYKYRWNNTGLTSSDIRNPLNKFQMYAGGGLDLWGLSPTGSFRMEKVSSRKRYYLQTDIVLFNRNKSSVVVGMEYKVGK